MIDVDGANPSWVSGNVLRMGLSEIAKCYSVREYHILVPTKDVIVDHPFPSDERSEWAKTVETLKKNNIPHRTMTVHDVFGYTHCCYRKPFRPGSISSQDF